MTNFEAITEDLRPYPIRKALVERKCEKHGLDKNAEATDNKTIAKIVIELLVQMITLNNVTEGGVAHSFNEKGVRMYIKHLCKEYGLDETEYIDEPSVTYLGDL